MRVNLFESVDRNWAPESTSAQWSCTLLWLHKVLFPFEVLVWLQHVTADKEKSNHHQSITYSWLFKKHPIQNRTWSCTFEPFLFVLDGYPWYGVVLGRRNREPKSRESDGLKATKACDAAWNLQSIKHRKNLRESKKIVETEPRCVPEVLRLVLCRKPCVPKCGCIRLRGATGRNLEALMFCYEWPMKSFDRWTSCCARQGIMETENDRKCL